MRSRRQFVKALAALPIVEHAGSIAASPAGALEPSAELGLSPGLIHLNTASAGPTSKRVMERTFAAWRQLETDPVAQSYFQLSNTIFTAADQVRSKAAALLGCTPDEILLTRGTT